MNVVFGLGNPGSDYDNTRHNVGFEAINKLAFDFDIKVNRIKLNSVMGEGFINGEKVILVKPITYMNLSGRCVRDVLNYYKLSPKDMVVIYDDINLPPGMIRIREKGSDGGHNGIKNIIYQLESDEFTRVKIGIGSKPEGWDLAKYVLSKISKDDLPLINEGITKATEAVELIMSDKLKEAMNLYNKKVR